MEADIGVPQWQTKEHPGMPSPPESGRSQTLCLGLWKEYCPANTLILDVWPPEL